MEKSILSHLSEMQYLRYLEELDSSDLLNEFYACHRLKRAIKSRVNRVCDAVCNHYCPLLVDIAHEEMTSYDHYFIRFLLRFELFVKRQQQHIIAFHDFHDPRPIRTAKPPAVLTPEAVFRIYFEVMEEFSHLEKIVSSFAEKTNMWLYFLYNRRDIPEEFKTVEYRDKTCAVKPDGSYDFLYQLELVYKELVWIVETEMNCDISVFRKKGR